jgi:predicted RNA-binding Zn ribbon-like protein
VVAFFLAICHSFTMNLEALFAAINDEELEPNSDLAVLREVLLSVTTRKNFDTRTMKKFGELTGKAHQHRRLKPSTSEIEFELVGISGSARRISEFALQVEDILVTVDLSRVKMCEGEECEALFVDESKNKSRRWCDMAHCGMLRKSKVFYDKHRRVIPVVEETKLGAKQQ